MGFFSWNTADTDESIANVHSGKPVKTVYLIQPNGLPAIKESHYQGHGHFGEIDAYAWLAGMNFGDEKLVDVAINADCGRYLEDDKAIYLCSLHLSSKNFKKVVPTAKKIVMFSNYNEVLPNGMTGSQMTAQGFSKSIELKYPLKFSFNPDAQYESLKASESCPFQGYFYDDED
jgi:hypothetical protein